MRRILPAFVIIVAACVSVAAQDAQVTQRPQPFDSFGELRFSDLMARLDNFAVALQGSPSARGYIVAYPGRDKFLLWPMRRAQQSRAYLTQERGLDAARVEVVDGELVEQLRFELWIVRAGEQLPVKRMDYALAFAGVREPVQVDQYYVFARKSGWSYDGSYAGYTNARDRFESLASFLRADPALRGCIIAYTTRRERRGADTQLAAREKRTLMSQHSIGAERVVVIGGGVRPHKTFELWLVPPGASLPRPTPTVNGVKRRRR
jgi:hypothetical protein